ncbi:thaumatin-like protein 1 [Phoenix dactylifera]|uniref:Thaumatin-like protein 1 n=1 Tax=Phoenix dactylifera TaxID=42345 RepID=A0A8B7BLH5_PHODC|nr:thaumatin-like protein 1 [Phoenix dactylifera]
MDPMLSSPVHFLSLSFFLIFFHSSEMLVECTAFTFVNKCGYTVWPGILSGSGSPELETTGFELATGDSRSLQAPTGWSGRFWGRTECSFDGAGKGSCATGDCGTGGVECKGSGAAPPATLAEFTLAGPASAKDFYDVSLVDGYNLPMVVDVRGGTGGCASTGCVVDLSRRCPAELRVGEACRSACEAFGKPEFCCSGAYASPGTCRPSVYSQMFKSACPKSYSYAFDDATSTFTCSGADYTVTFCPDSAPSQNSQKSARDYPTPRTGGVVLEDDSWLASLAAGAAPNTKTRVSFLHQSLLILSTTAFILLLL